MKYGRAFAAGVIGAAVMSVFLALARAMGMPANLETMLGSMMVGTVSTAAYLVGLLMHLMLGGLFALLYAFGFEYVTHRGGWLAGLGFAAIHIVVAGVGMGTVPTTHPLVPSVLPASGAFMSHLGAMGVGAFVMLHLVYGAIVGGMYGEALHAPGHVGAPRHV